MINVGVTKAWIRNSNIRWKGQQFTRFSHPQATMNRLPRCLSVAHHSSRFRYGTFVGRPSSYICLYRHRHGQALVAIPSSLHALRPSGAVHGRPCWSRGYSSGPDQPANQSFVMNSFLGKMETAELFPFPEGGPLMVKI